MSEQKKAQEIALMPEILKSSQKGGTGNLTINIGTINVGLEMDNDDEFEVIAEMTEKELEDVLSRREQKKNLEKESVSSIESTDDGKKSISIDIKSVLGSFFAQLQAFVVAKLTASAGVIVEDKAQTKALNAPKKITETTEVTTLHTQKSHVENLLEHRRQQQIEGHDRSVA